VIEFSEVKFSEVYEEILPMLKEHKEEIDLFGLPLDVNIEVYKACEKLGCSKSYAARENGVIIGYALYFVSYHNHHRTSLHAKLDVIFIDKKKRGFGLNFMKYCEKELQSYKVDFIHQSVPKINDWSHLVLKMGYKELETTYTKEL
jgi:hypothetical protein